MKPENLLSVSAGIRNISNQILQLKPHIEHTSAADPDTSRTYSHVKTSKLPFSRAFSSIVHP